MSKLYLCQAIVDVASLSVFDFTREASHELAGHQSYSWQCTKYKKGLRGRNSPMCTLSQNGYGDDLEFLC